MNAVLSPTLTSQSSSISDEELFTTSQTLSDHASLYQGKTRRSILGSDCMTLMLLLLSECYLTYKAEN